MSLIFPSYVSTVTTSTTVIGDSTITYVVLQLPGDGANNSTNNTFIDSSTNNATITRTGTPIQGSVNPFGSNWSNYFNGSSYLTMASNSSFAFGTGDFTVEGWINPTSLPTYCTICSTRTSSGTTAGWNIGVSSSGQLFLYANGFMVTGASSGVRVGEWTHFAIVRSGTSLKAYVNGIQSGSTGSDSNDYTIQTFWTGATGGTSEPWYGYISNLRIIKGTALYTSTFTPSTTLLTTVTNTSLLTCATNRFQDISTVSNTITITGAVSVQKFAPFSTSASYSTSTNGGSIYFDGSTYMSTPNSGDLQLNGVAWTIEMWYYPTQLTAYNVLLAKRGAGGDQYQIFTDVTTGYLAFYNGGVALYSSTAPKLNAWNYIAFVHNGSSTLTMYLNGVNFYSGTTTIPAGTSQLWIGQDGSASNTLYGYLSNVRIVKGTQLYTTTFTPPTAPLTVITGTSFLLLGTNNGIVDTAMQNNLLTVGDAKISTTQSKFGGSSMYFDGTGDYLLIPSNPVFAFGSGDYTVECWIYSQSTAQQVLFASGGTGANNFYFSFVPTSSFIGVGTQNVWILQATGLTLSTSVWYHVAASRSSGTLRLFLNGTQVASGADSTVWIQGGYTAIGSNAQGTQYTNGYIDDLRITKGVARYTATFTPSTSANPDTPTYTTTVSSTTYITSFTTGSYVWVYNTSTSRWWSTQEPTQTYTLTPSLIEDQGTTSTGYIDFPYGSTAQRPGSPTLGYMRFNTDLGYIEYYSTASIWIQIPNQNT